MQRAVITGTLLTRTALHVGTGRGGVDVDALLRRTAGGALVIPGESIAGALRTLATRLAPRLDPNGRACRALLPPDPQGRLGADGVPVACGCLVCYLFGDIDPQASNDEAKGGRAARLWVFDAMLEDDEPADGRPPTAIRDGVGIDRATGAAARRDAVKFNMEVLPAGARFRLRMELETGGLAPDAERLLAATLGEFVAGRANVGGRAARGLGAVTLEDLAYARPSLETIADVVEYLRDDDPTSGFLPVPAWLADQVAAARDRLTTATGPARQWSAGSWIDIRLTLQASGPFLANDAARSRRAGVDHAPLIEGHAPVLPGASLRGVLRSHAERIARTLAMEGTVDAPSFARRRVACNPLARSLKPNEKVPLQCCDALLEAVERSTERDLDEVDEGDLCLACRLFGSARRGSRLVVEDAFASAAESAGDWKVQDFLAIDRFTGGGRNSAKFDAVSLWRPTFRARLRLANPQGWELGWLVLVLRDLAEGQLRLGFGGAKGYGSVTVPEWTAEIGWLTEGDFPVAAETSGDLSSSRAAEALPWEGATYVDDSVYRVARVGGGVTVDTTSPGVGPTWRLDDDARPWLAAAKGWVAAFNAAVANSDVTPGGAYPDAFWDDVPDTYFGQTVAALVGSPWPEVTHGR